MPAELRVLPIGEEELVVFRVVTTHDRSSGAFLDCFRSSFERGIPPRRRSAEERVPAVHRGSSVFDARGQAESVARRFTRLGGYTAQLRLPSGRGFSYARWGSPGHLTLWGDAAELAAGAAVVDVVPVPH